VRSCNNGKNMKCWLLTFKIFGNNSGICCILSFLYTLPVLDFSYLLLYYQESIRYWLILHFLHNSLIIYALRFHFYKPWQIFDQVSWSCPFCVPVLIFSSYRGLEMADQYLVEASYQMSMWFHSCLPHEMCMHVENILICLVHCDARPGRGSARMYLECMIY